jgi:hypothetical protein
MVLKLLKPLEKEKAMQRDLGGFPHERLHQEGKTMYLVHLRMAIKNS